MVKIIDACGLACPAPVLLVKDAVEQGKEQEIRVLVDNEGSQENVHRFLTTRGYQVHTAEEGGVYRLDGRREGEAVDAASEESLAKTEEQGQKILVLIASEYFGSGDDQLGAKLMTAYLKTLKEMGTDLWQLILVNGGVKLTTASSPVLQELQDFEQSGVIVLACGTCLEHFQLTAEKRVGSTTNMLDIVTATQLADKVISLS